MCELFIKFSDGVPGGRCRASVPRPGPSLSGVLTARVPMCVQFSNVCAVFDHVKPPKNARIVDKNKIKKKNPEENNRALRLSGLGPNNN